MGRKLVRENEWLPSGGFLSFPRTGCALRAAVILSPEQGSHPTPRLPPKLAPNSQLFAGKLPFFRGSAE